MANNRRPSVTTHALLGLLSLRSWTAYDLTAQMRRALRYAWPRTEASLYSEIKQLAPRGFAMAREEESAGRVRTRYEITNEGRAAVALWLQTSPAPVQVQFETLLRLFVADQGSRDTLLATIRATRRQTVEAIEEVLPVVQDYAGDAPPFADRAHLNGLFIAFIADFLRLVMNWCEMAETEIRSWPDTSGVGHTSGTRQMVDDALAFYQSVVESNTNG